MSTLPSLLAVIPYFEPVSFDVGSWTIGLWEILVATAFIVGMEIARARGIKQGLDVRNIVDGIVVTVGLGFVGGHLMHVLAYNPHLIEEEGWITLLKVWAGLSSTGGFLGAIVGAVLFHRIRGAPFWRHADLIAYGFPFGWAIARFGCFSAHDHIGVPSDFFLAVDFPGGARHDLGLYEALWTVAIAATFFALRKRDVKPGFFVALLTVMYVPVRFFMDFLRATDISRADQRYGGLTPAQWVMIALFLAGIWLVLRLRGGAGEPGEQASEG